MKRKLAESVDELEDVQREKEAVAQELEEIRQRWNREESKSAEYFEEIGRYKQIEIELNGKLNKQGREIARIREQMDVMQK